LPGLAALGAEGRFVVGLGLSSGIGVEVLLEQPVDEVGAEFLGALLTLIEGDELVLVNGVEHEVVGGSGKGEETLAAGVGVTVGLGWSIVHDGNSHGIVATAAP
jgi:hypothetical protein